MPSSSLNVPHFQQELDYSCVAACVRMILAHYGDVRNEAEFRFRRINYASSEEGSDHAGQIPHH